MEMYSMGRRCEERSLWPELLRRWLNKKKYVQGLGKRDEESSDLKENKDEENDGLKSGKPLSL